MFGKSFFTHKSQRFSYLTVFYAEKYGTKFFSQATFFFLRVLILRDLEDELE